MKSSRSNGPTTASTRGVAAKTRWITRSASSTVTASISATSSSTDGTSSVVSSLRPIRCMRLELVSSASAVEPLR